MIPLYRALDILALAELANHRDMARDNLSDEEYACNTKLNEPVLTLLQKTHPELVPLDIVRLASSLVSEQTNDKVKLLMFMAGAYEWLESQSKGAS